MFSVVPELSRVHVHAYLYANELCNALSCALFTVCGSSQYLKRESRTV